MNRARDRASAKGLLPRMEARVGKKATTYRYHPLVGKPINLGQDLDAAIRQVRKAYNNGTPTEVVEQLHAAVNDCEESYIVLVNQMNEFARSRA